MSRDAVLTDISHRCCGPNSHVLTVPSQASVLFPAFPPVFVEKMRVLAVMNEWEQAVDVAQTLLKADSRNIHALHMVRLCGHSHAILWGDSAERRI